MPGHIESKFFYIKKFSSFFFSVTNSFIIFLSLRGQYFLLFVSQISAAVTQGLSFALNVWHLSHIKLGCYELFILCVAELLKD